MDKCLGPTFRLREQISNGSLAKIGFQDLWHLYQPGTVIVSSARPRQAYKVLHVCGGRVLMRQPRADTWNSIDDSDESGLSAELKHRDWMQKSEKLRTSHFSIDCVSLDFDGELLGPIYSTFAVAPYDNEKTVTSLDVHPIRFADDFENLSHSLIARGRRFAYCADSGQPIQAKHKAYNGPSLDEPPEEVCSASQASDNTSLSQSH